MAEDNITDRLQQIWQQGHRNMAVAFLKRAITMDSTLAEVAAALQFDAVRGFVDGIRLRDVLTSTPMRSPVAQSLVGGAKPMASRPRKRKRRGPKEMKEIKELLLEMLRDEPGSLDSTQLHDGLAKLGNELDRITLNRLLGQLEQERHITCLGGRPKAWRSVGLRQPALARDAGYS